MAGNETTISSTRIVGLARAWGAYVRSLAAGIVVRQAKIESRINGASSGKSTSLQTTTS